jgi:hypothetical protein
METRTHHVKVTKRTLVNKELMLIIFKNLSFTKDYLEVDL